MLKKGILLTGLLLAAAGCVSRTVYRDSSLKGGSEKPKAETKLIWFWQDEY